MNKVHRNLTVIATVALLALLVVPTAGASETAERPIAEPVSAWTMALDFVAPISDWFLGAIGWTPQPALDAGIGTVTIEGVGELNQISVSRRIQGGTDPVGLDRD